MPFQFPRQFLCIFLSFLLIFETIPLKAMGPAGKEKQERLQEIFDGKSEDLGKGEKHPLIRHSRESGSPVHSSKAKSLDGVHIAQLSDYHRLNNCFASGRCPGMSPGPKADPPGIKAGTSQPSSSGSSSNSSSSNSSGNPSWAGRQSGFTVLFVLGLIGLALGIGVIAAGGAAAAGISAGALNAIWGVSGSFAAAGLLGMLPKEAWEGIGKAFAATGTVIGGLLAGLLHNLLLGFVDLKIDSDSTWAKIFNVSQEIGKWLTLIGGATAGFTTAGLTMAGVLNLPSVLVPVGFSVGGAMTGSGLTQLVTFAVKKLKLKASESDRDEERSKTYALKGEISKMEVADEDIQKALNGLEKPPWPTGKLTLAEETEHNKTLSEYYKKYQEALKELKGNKILKRNREQEAQAALKKSLNQVFSKDPLNLKDKSDQSKIYQGWSEAIQKDLNKSPPPTTPKPKDFFRLYPKEGGGYLKVHMSDKSGQVEVLKTESLDIPWKQLKFQDYNLPADETFTGASNARFDQVFWESVQEAIKEQEKNLRIKAHGFPDQWDYNDKFFHLIIHDPIKEITLFYEKVYRSNAQGDPEPVSSDVFIAPREVESLINGIADAGQGSVSFPLLVISRQQEPVYADEYDEGGDSRIKGYRTVYGTETKSIHVPLDLSNIPAEQPRQTNVKTSEQEEMDKICKEAKDKAGKLKAKGQRPDAALAELLKQCEAAASRTETQEEIREGMTVYRVYGGVSRRIGPHWTDKNPRMGYIFDPRPNNCNRTIYRSKAGLPTTNSGEFFVKATIKDPKKVFRTPGGAKPARGCEKLQMGGWPELVIDPTALEIPPDPQSDEVIEPPF